MTPTTCLPFTHARRRTRERYGLDLTAEDFAAICLRIARADGAVFLRVYKTGSAVWVAVRLYGGWLPVVWQSREKYIATVFSPNVIEQYAVPLLRWEARHVGRV